MQFLLPQLLSKHNNHHHYAAHCKIEYETGLGFWPLKDEDVLVVVSAFIVGLRNILMNPIQALRKDLEERQNAAKSVADKATVKRATKHVDTTVSRRMMTSSSYNTRLCSHASPVTLLFPEILASLSISRLQRLCRPHTHSTAGEMPTLWCLWSTTATMCHWSMQNQRHQLVSLPVGSLWLPIALRRLCSST